MDNQFIHGLIQGAADAEMELIVQRNDPKLLKHFQCCKGCGEKRRAKLQSMMQDLPQRRRGRPPYLMKEILANILSQEP
ncbi:MAG: hypothetical protein KGJ13_02590 [Patescibacteria group bacterium]|nr:hypothetical protein [Patescibacteria group bacterium]